MPSTPLSRLAVGLALVVLQGLGLHAHAGPGDASPIGVPVETGSTGRFYGLYGADTAWIGHPERVAIIEAALRRAGEHGIADRTIAAALDSAKPEPGDREGAKRAELALTRAALRYAEALSGARLDPSRLYDDWAIDRAPADAAAGLASALRSGSLEAWLARLPPDRPEYTGLIAALARYRTFAAGETWPQLPDERLMRRGADDPVAVPLLRRRLALEGYAVDPVGDVLDAPLARALAEFQRRHGLLEDGVLGNRTVSALNVSAAERVETIRLNLERWRWMKRDLPPRRIAVNAAAASLTAWDENRMVLSMRAIVGDHRHPTPIFESEIGAVILNPPWDVPRSITRREILPLLSRDPDYLRQHDMIVRDRDARGVPRLRQLPGPKNALGFIKLEIPSRFDVYLHDTPDRKLFARASRHLSHGCIRVEKPLALATYVLGSQDDWNAEKLEAAIGEGKTRRIPVRIGATVVIGYWTAFVDEGGAVEFREDVYGRDAVLRDALAAAEADGSSSPLTSGDAADVGCGPS